METSVFPKRDGKVYMAHWNNKNCHLSKRIHISRRPLGGHAGMMGMEKLPSASQATIRGTSTKVRYKVRGR